MLRHFIALNEERYWFCHAQNRVMIIGAVFVFSFWSPLPQYRHFLSLAISKVSEIVHRLGYIVKIDVFATAIYSGAFRSNLLFSLVDNNVHCSCVGLMLSFVT